ncbi:MAG: hypothetical protein RI917_6 [Actinomycetota bacterium]
MTKLFGAIDIGATSGRVIAGFFEDGKISISEVHRFPNGPVSGEARLTWKFDALLAEVKIGLRKLGELAEQTGQTVTSVGIDMWAVDYGLVSNGTLVQQPSCYRDPQNELGVRLVHERISFAKLYEVNGLQFLPFNTIYQITKHSNLDPTSMDVAENLMLLPDLLGYFLTGKMATERTNASSTGLLDANTREWSNDIATRLDINLALFPPLADAGDILGELGEEFGPTLSATKVVLVGSHDTASAVVGVPATDPNFAFISSGTWSLLGAEIPEPILNSESRESNFTNELGVDGRVRFLKNLSGLWLLSECIRDWERTGLVIDLPKLLSDAAEISPFSFLIDVNDQAFISPDDMPLKIARQLTARGFSPPKTPAEFTSLILHSLASSYAQGMFELEKLTGLAFDVIYVIGGGSQNELLSQLTANATGKVVRTGPVEATALGNLLVQARTAGIGGPTLEDLRAMLLASDFASKTYKPQS